MPNPAGLSRGASTSPIRPSPITPTVSFAIAVPFEAVAMSPRLLDIGNMIDAAVIGRGRWGKSLVTAVQGKSGRLRFVHGVSKEPDEARALAGQHAFRLPTDLADAVAYPAVQAVFLATPHS